MDFLSIMDFLSLVGSLVFYNNNFKGYPLQKELIKTSLVGFVIISISWNLFHNSNFFETEI